MKVKDVMTANPTCCTPSTPLREVARMMVDCDCGEIPVVENEGSRHLVGVLTDRDITVRTVAQGINPLETTAGEVMTGSPISVTPATEMDDCCNLMEENRIRRVPVLDESGSLCGIVSLADVALRGRDRKDTLEVVKEVSQPAHH
ncbi:MAG TPA: CBS domain-containing protein [Xanthomonadaceae bacterium]|nr:CBS domain-containing protein [Xanthomonadaceae bacterium]